jgi:hypothetical protein
MTPEETAEVARIAGVRKRMMRPALFAAIGMTLFGNLAAAQPSVGGWLSHGWAPVLYLVLVEILIARAIGAGWVWFVVAGLLAVAAIAGIVSFFTLQAAAIEWGWHPGEAWMFPAIVDAAAIALTCALAGSQAKVRSIEEIARDRTYQEAVIARETEEAEATKGGRPRSMNSRRAQRELSAAQAESRAAKGEPDVRTREPDAAVLELYALCGEDPSAWPGPTDYSKKTGKSKSGAQGILQRARAHAARTAVQATEQPSATS